MSEQQYDDNNKASLWVNDKKVEDWHADFNGTAKINNVEYYANLMKVDSDNAKAPKWRMTFTPKIKKEDTSGAVVDKMLKDEIPF